MNIFTQAPGAKPAKPRRKWWIWLILLFVLCLLAVCIWMVVYFLKSMRPEPFHAYHYRQAAISPMVTACTEDYYTEPQPWMNLSAGYLDVLLLDHSQMGLAPDAFYAYSFYLAVDPGLLVTGAELTLPGAGLQPFLVETRAPLLYCTDELTGSLRILQVADDGTVWAYVDVTRAAAGPVWEYRGEVEYTYPPLP